MTNQPPSQPPNDDLSVFTFVSRVDGRTFYLSFTPDGAADLAVIIMQRLLTAYPTIYIDTVHTIRSLKRPRK